MKEDAKFFFPEDYDNVPFALKSIGVTYKDANYQIHRTNPNIFVFEYVISGRGVINTPNGTFSAVAGDSFFLNAHEAYDYYSDPDNPMEKIWVNVVGRLPKAMLDTYGLRTSMLLPKIDCSSYLGQIHRIVRNSENDIDTMNYQSCTVYLRLCQFIYRNLVIANEVQPIPENFVQLKNYINLHLDVPLTIEQCNKITCLSTSQTIRKFREYFGVAPYEYLNNRRIECAKDMLRTSSLSIHDIACQLGFQDQNYFSKYFKKKCGYSPTQYRDYK